MRFTGRSAPDRLSTTTADEVLQLGDAQLPVKAEAFLGAKYRLASRRSVKKLPQEEKFRHVPNEDQKSLGNLLRAQEALLDTQEALLRNMPSNNKSGPSLWPNVETSNRSMNDFMHNGQQPNSRRPGIPPRRTSVKAVDQYYDAARQPLHVSQQTSASAVRDMALRKGSPMIHETSSESALVKRPLKSALKKASDSKGNSDGLLRPSSSRAHTNEKKTRRLDLSHFFPQPWANSNRNLLSPNKLSRSPSTMTDTSEFFPRETVQVQLKRPAAHGRFGTYKSDKPASIDSESTTRPKVFETDIFDSAKTNVRRPPKGIQNWFDGFDISSDEEGEPQELPASEVSPLGEALPSVFSPWIKPENEQPVFDRMASVDPVEDNLLAIEHARERMQERMRAVENRKGSIDSGTIESYVSSDAPGKRRGGESRLASSRLASESILSLSESGGSSEDEQPRLATIRGSVDDRSIAVHDASPVEVQRPHGLPRKLYNKQSGNRESVPRYSTSTIQTSGSIPIRLTGSVPIPDLSTLPAPPNQPVTKKEIDPTAQALRRLNGIRDSASQASRSQRTTQIVPAIEYENSATGETASSMPSDAAHIMAVTEEEMALLEMMRNKRAAMQKNSFAEGYQLALTREQEHLARRRESAQKTAHQILRKRQEKANRDSRIESVAEEALDPLDLQRRKYSAIRKEDVDKALKLERFLAASETPIEDAFPEPPTRTPVEEPRRLPQALELLLPDTYSPTSSKGLDEPVSPCADTSPAPGDDDIEDHHHRVRQFLASSSASESASMFPTPPSALSKRADSRRSKRKSMISPSPVVEEEPIPSLPDRSVSRPSPDEEHRKQRRRSINERHRSAHIDIDDLLESVSSSIPLPIAPLKSTSGKSSSTTHQNPYHLAPNFDFTPLDFSMNTIAEGGSPSLSTSHASPLTPTFTPYPPTTSEKTSTAPDIASSDNASLREHRRAYTPDTDLTSLSASASLRFPAPTGSAGKKRPTAAPAPATTTAGAGGVTTTAQTPSSTTARNKDLPLPPPVLSGAGAGGFDAARGSVTSMTSAGEDVLAAWAELGGGREVLASRRRVR